MTCLIDLSLGGDRRDAIHRIVECLVGGGIARLKWESGDDLLALATHEDSTTRLAAVQENHSSALMVSRVEALADFVPTVSCEISRLFLRSVTPTCLSFADDVDDRILRQLPSVVSRFVTHQGELRIAIPVTNLIREVLRLLPGPVVALGFKESSDYDLVDIEVHLASVSRQSPQTVVRCHGGSWRIAESGGLNEEEICRMMAERIVFVCTGNTCRSPMAAGMLRKFLAERLACSMEALPLHGFEVVSAGVSATRGAPASPESIAICAEHGVDLRSHASQPLQLQLVESSDSLYTMTAGHREAILHQFPEHAERVRLLSRQGRDVSDPIGSGPAAYEHCFWEITEHLHALVNELTASTR